MTVAGILPTITRDLKRATDSTGREYHRFGVKHAEASALAIVPECPHAAARIGQERQQRRLHLEIDALMNSMILQGADHFQASAIADVGQARIAMTAEVALQDAAVFGAIEHCAPGFEFLHPRG